MKKIIIDDEFYLSEISEADCFDLIESIGDYEVFKNLKVVPHPYTKEDANWWINHVKEDHVKIGKPIHWVIRNSEGKLIGGIDRLLKYGEDAHKDEIGYWLGKAYWGKGIMTKILKVYCQHLFDTSNLVRVEAPVFSRNIGSAKVLEKNGFKFEGILEKAYFKEGEYLDGKMYALVKGSH